MIDFILKSDYFKEMINTIRLIDKEATILFNSEGAIVNILDPAGIAMFVMHIDKSAFDKYETQMDTVVCLDAEKVKSLSKALKGTCTFHIDDFATNMEVTSDRAKLNINLLSNDGKGHRRLPDLTYEVKLTLSKAEVKSSLETCSVVDSEICLITDNDGISFVSHSDTDYVTMLIPIAETGNKELKHSKAFFDNAYLTNMVKGMISESIVLNLCDDYPLTMEFSIMDGKVPCKYIQAPRIHEDGE